MMSKTCLFFVSAAAGFVAAHASGPISSLLDPLQRGGAMDLNGLLGGQGNLRDAVHSILQPLPNMNFARLQPDLGGGVFDLQGADKLLQQASDNLLDGMGRFQKQIFDSPLLQPLPGLADVLRLRGGLRRKGEHGLLLAPAKCFFPENDGDPVSQHLMVLLTNGLGLDSVVRAAYTWGKKFEVLSDLDQRSFKRSIERKMGIKLPDDIASRFLSVDDLTCFIKNSRDSRKFAKQIK